MQSKGTLIFELNRIPLLSDLDEAQLLSLSGVVERRSVKKGKYVLRAGDPGEFVMFVASGKLKVERSGGGRVLVLDYLRPGDFCGELALLTGRCRSADVRAVENSVILVLSRQDFKEHILSNSSLALAILGSLASRLHATSVKAAELGLLDVYRRLARVLASLAEVKHLEDGDVKVIEERPTHRDLAALTGTSREMITRALKDLEMAGHISVEGRKVVVHSLPA